MTSEEYMKLVNNIIDSNDCKELRDLKIYKLRNEVKNLENFELISSIFLALGADQHEVFDD